jgi:hypothetical protein
MPCVTVSIEEPSKQTYLQVAIESSTDICVYDKARDAVQSCGSRHFFCEPNGYKGVGTVTFQFDCENCPAADTSFYFRVNMQTLDKVDEYWCDNANRTLPSDLAQNMNTAFTPSWYDNANRTLPSDLAQNMNTAFTPSDITQQTVPTASAPTLFVAPALLVVSALIAALSI